MEIDNDIHKTKRELLLAHVADQAQKMVDDHFDDQMFISESNGRLVLISYYQEIGYVAESNQDLQVCIPLNNKENSYLLRITSKGDCFFTHEGRRVNIFLDQEANEKINKLIKQIHEIKHMRGKSLLHDVDRGVNTENDSKKRTKNESDELIFRPLVDEKKTKLSAESESSYPNNQSYVEREHGRSRSRSPLSHQIDAD